MFARIDLEYTKLRLESDSIVVLRLPTILGEDILYELSPTSISKNTGLYIYEYESRKMYDFLVGWRYATKLSTEIPTIFVAGGRIGLVEPWNSLVFLFRATSTMKEVDAGRISNVIAVCRVTSRIYCHTIPEVDVAIVKFGKEKWKYGVAGGRFSVPRKDVIEFMLQNGFQTFVVVGRATMTSSGRKVALYFFDEKSIRVDLEGLPRR